MAFYISILSRSHQKRHERFQKRIKNLGHNFINDITQRNRLKLGGINCLSFFGDESNESRIKRKEDYRDSLGFIYESPHIHFENIPTMMKKVRGKSI
jgi:hypothetical protein